LPIKNAVLGVRVADADASANNECNATIWRTVAREALERAVEKITEAQDTPISTFD